MCTFGDSELQEMDIPIGNMSVRVVAPMDREESDERISFWWGVTSSAVALSRQLATHAGLEGARVVELGCGLGLAGITAGLLGAWVTFTDYMPEALEYARRNALLNGLDEDRIALANLDWEAPAVQGTFDLVIGSEIAYDYFTHSALIKVMERLLASGGRILMAERNRLAVSRFVGRLIGRGFEASAATSTIVVPGLPNQEITIFTLQRLPEEYSEALLSSG
jgi:predicted nicotinamide N-methyase